MSQALARFLVFFTSAVVLVIEILAIRVLAPYLGISLAVFTGVIGVILAGISAGAWVGGRAADTHDPRRLIGPALVLGGITAMLSPLIIDAIGPNLSNDPGSIIVAATLGFFLPAAILSTIPPMVVKIRLSSLEQTGTVVGSYSAVGTAGAIFGSFLTGFFLVAQFHTRPVLAAVGATLIAVGLLIWGRRGRWATVASVVVGVGIGAILVVGSGPCQVETAYHCAIVEVDAQRPSGRTLILDRLHNSYVDLDDPTYLRFRYVQLMADIVETMAPQGPLVVVSVGGGGMTLPGYFQATRPGSRNTVLEIDGGVVDLAREELGLDDRIEVTVDDARISTRQLVSGSADVVVGDAFSGASVPWHLTTVEYFTDIRRVLTDTGLYTMNVIDAGGMAFARATAITLSEVFENVALFAPASYLSGERGGNFVFVASPGPIDITRIETAIAQRGGLEVGVSAAALLDFAGDAPVLIDDFAPVDQMLEFRG